MTKRLYGASVLVALFVGAVPVQAAETIATTAPAPSAVSLSPVGSTVRGVALYEIDEHAWRQAMGAISGPSRFIQLSGLTDDFGLPLQMELSLKRVVGSWTTFELGTETGTVRTHLDTQRIVRLSGPVLGEPGSWATLIAIDGEGFGRVMRHGGVDPILFRFRVGDQPSSSAWFFDREPVVPDNDPWTCSIEADSRGTRGHDPAPPHRAAIPGSPFKVTDDPLGPPTKNLRGVKLGVQSDYELYQIFDMDEQKALTYIAAMYEIVSDILERDVRVRTDLAYVKLWTVPGDPWGSSYGNPVGNHPVPIDVAQMFSGVQTGGGGAASLPGTGSYVHGAQGLLGQGGGLFDQDPFTCAHEIGHNFGSGHNHDYGLDQCGNASGLPRRGTIMSYCTQAWSGGKYNADMFFHTFTADKINQTFKSGFWATKGIKDCNQNAIADAQDITSGFSQDANANTIPDECEDCNGNGILDTIDISSGASQDLDANTIPDECEPDCNNNGSPDALDIKNKVSTDAYGNGVPDECEPDADESGASDITEIHLDMTLDLDRNVKLDAFEDCNDNQTPDLLDLQHAHSFYAVSSSNSRIQEHHAKTGVLVNKSADGLFTLPKDLITTPDRRVLVSDAMAHKVLAFDADLNSLGTLIPAGSGGLNTPTGLLWRPDGSLLVSNQSDSSILRFDGTTGAFLDVLVQPGASGLTKPTGMTLGPGGGLYVGHQKNEILEFDAMTGEFRRIFVASGSNGGISGPRSVVFLANPDRCLAVGSNSNTIYQYDGLTGAYMKVFNNGSMTNKMLSPFDLTVGPTGDVFVGHVTGADNHLTEPKVMQFDGTTGQYRRSFVMSKDSQLVSPVGIAFMPDVEPAGTAGAVDCNTNFRLDSCDIALGYSLDTNRNGIPDECESGGCYPDCDGSGSLDIDDFVCFQTNYALGLPAADCDGSGGLDIDDFVCFQTFYAIGC